MMVTCSGLPFPLTSILSLRERIEVRVNRLFAKSSYQPNNKSPHPIRDESF